MADLIIIGAGPAGLSAGIYGARGRADTVVIGDIARSRTYRAKAIDNYFGFPESITGQVLLELGVTQYERFGGRMVSGEVVGIRLHDEFEVELADGSAYRARAIILATGVSAKSSGIRFEDELVGRGVSYCANCDAFFYRNRKVAVIGSGNFAAKEALELVPHTRDVTIFSHGGPFQIGEALREELRRASVALREEKVVEFVGDEQLDALKLHSGELWTAEGAFLAIGTASVLDFARTLGLEIQKNCIVVDAEGRTNFPGIFAAGDCTGQPLQIAKAVGQGCSAAIAAMGFLRHKD